MGGMIEIWQTRETPKNRDRQNNSLDRQLSIYGWLGARSKIETIRFSSAFDRTWNTELYAITSRLASSRMISADSVRSKMRPLNIFYMNMWGTCRSQAALFRKTRYDTRGGTEKVSAWQRDARWNLVSKLDIEMESHAVV